MLAIRHDDPMPPLKLSTSPRPVRASIGARRNPESTRAILDAAEMILRREGLAGFSMDAIARQAKCGKPTLYRWWPEKCVLLADLHERALPGFESAGSASGFEEKLQQLVNGWVHAWRTTLAGVALRGMIAEAQQSSAARTVLIDRGLAPYRNAIEPIREPADLTEPGESRLEQVLFPLLGELMLMGDATPRAVSQGLARRSDVPSEPLASVRHRGEWVD